jgi:hypothetical protein
MLARSTSIGLTVMRASKIRRPFAHAVRIFVRDARPSSSARLRDINSCAAASSSPAFLSWRIADPSSSSSARSFRI